MRVAVKDEYVAPASATRSGWMQRLRSHDVSLLYRLYSHPYASHRLEDWHRASNEWDSPGITFLQRPS
jgi:hypothetical protein